MPNPLFQALTGFKIFICKWSIIFFSHRRNSVSLLLHYYYFYKKKFRSVTCLRSNISNLHGYNMSCHVHRKEPSSFFSGNFFPSTAFCGRVTRGDASQIKAILIYSKTRSTFMFPTYPHDCHFLPRHIRPLRTRGIGIIQSIRTMRFIRTACRFEFRVLLLLDCVKPKAM